MYSLSRKCITSFTAGLTVAALLLVLGNSGTLVWFPPIIVFSLVGLCLLTAISFPLVWQYWERKQRINSVTTYGYLIALIRYSVAFNVASFGWKKLFGLQFIVPLDMASRPMNQQPGETLTWFYFGYSPTFGTLIALIQLVGAYGLLFRKTFLISTIVLFTLILNIALVDIFYHLNVGATLQGVVLTLGLLFLILTEYPRLVTFFLASDPLIPSVDGMNSSAKHLLRISAIGLSLLFVYYIARL